MQLGFVIDHSRCIGCHACTVACKSENQVPVGDFRTWVKYTEEGEFPEVRRSFAVLRCNQCTDAPCVTICPVSALDKEGNGIVDVDPKACIGCKACMHGCPYDALYINEETGTAEKCHFCAHRTELGLAPACAVVCPTEAIIPGDFDDPNSRVAQLKAGGELSARKLEAGTNPNVWYREVNQSGIDPMRTNLAGGSIWSDRVEGQRLDAQVHDAHERQAPARTVYDVPRKQLWGGKITGYLFLKSIAAGAFPVAWAARRAADSSEAWAGTAGTLLALAALGLTCLLLVADLKKPSRFLYILLRPNWSSWLARGTFFLTGYGLLLGIWLLVGADMADAIGGTAAQALAAVTSILGFLSASYTGWLFSQAKGRVLWMKRGYWAHLAVQACLAASAALLLVQPLLALVPDLAFSKDQQSNLGTALLLSLALHLVFTLLEGKLAPAKREAEYERSAKLISHGPYARLHWRVGVGVGVVLPVALLLVQNQPLVWAVAGLAALVGLWVEEDVFVRAGQAQPIS